VRLDIVCLALGFGIIALACGPAKRSAPDVPPPVAKVEPTELEKHGDVRVDNYYWLRERESSEVIEYLEAENSYLDAVFGHTEAFRDELFEEIVGRIKQDDASVPYKKGDYYYFWRFPEDGEYRIYSRRRDSVIADEEVMLDGNAMAEGHGFFSLRGVDVSPRHDRVAYMVDTVGRRKYTLRFRDLTTGEDLPDEIADVTPNGDWANDNKTYFYTRQHPDTLRWYQVYKHVLGTDPADDVLVYEETDEEFSSFVYKTKSERFLIIGSNQTLSSEYRYLEADDPSGEFEVFLPREADHEYAIDHHGDRFLVRTNWQAKNFRLMEAPIGTTGKESWKELIAHRDDVLLGNAEVFKDHLVISERKGGLIQMRIRPWDGGEEHYLDFGEPAYTAYFENNTDMDSTVLRYGYESLTTPDSVIDYDMVSREKTLLKEQEVLGGFDKADYKTERLEGEARDGTMVPISLVYRPDMFKGDGSNPLLLYGYGSYGSSMDASFRSDRLSLIDRGFVYAIAHIRGGQEMGRQWYEDGKLLKKMNTFTDFIDCGKHLVAEGYTSPDRMYALGGSAGGLLMGAVTNLAPELFHGVVSAVAFVDVVTTMLDDTIPLTTSEYDEWGNPHEKEYYDYMLSYSPYDQLEAKDYPHLLLTTGLHDSQVQYWEPAKYVAKLRSLKTDDNLLLLKTDMESGHGGASGRFRRHKDTALMYSFLLELSDSKPR
jgi:oligopeptidase B